MNNPPTAEFIFWLLIAHFIGDYLLQSHWMAVNKVERWWPALVHGVFYTIPFVFVLGFQYDWTLGAMLLPLWIIAVTHAVIDHYRLAKHIGWLKNQIGPRGSRPSWEEARENGGYNKYTPAWLANFLLFVTDNTMHVIINFAAAMIPYWLYLTLS